MVYTGLQHYFQVPEQTLVVGKVRTGNDTCRVIDGRMKSKLFISAEPFIRCCVDLQQFALEWLALPAWMLLVSTPD
jgi:hypothetical protein